MLSLRTPSIRIQLSKYLMTSMLDLSMFQLTFLEMPSFLAKPLESSKFQRLLKLKSMVFRKHFLKPKERLWHWRYKKDCQSFKDPQAQEKH
jgi:hypothetical protein